MPFIAIILAVLGTAVSLAQGKLACDGYILRDIYCYAVDTFSETFEILENSCNFDGASLASIHDAEENAFVSSLGDQIEIGLNNISGVVQWTDGSPVDYTNFADGELDERLWCTKIVNGLWYNIGCGRDRLVESCICKKKATNFPDRPTYECPSPDIVYSDQGILYSPGYPDVANLSHAADCMYHLKGKEGYRVYLEVESIDMADLQVYEGWAVDNNKLLTKSVDPGEVVSTKDSNLMLVVYSSQGPDWYGAYFKLSFYTEDVRPTTKDPSMPATTEAITTNCPAQSTFDMLEHTIASPGFPFSYAVNTNCMYYFNVTYADVYDIEILELQIGGDDYIELIDSRNGDVFARTNTNIFEGSKHLATFPFAVHFRSGNVEEMFGRWRIFVAATEDD